MTDHPSSEGSSRKQPANLPKPHPFHITEPFQERGLWCFWLAADPHVLEYVSNLHCILQTSMGSTFSRRLRGRVMFAINPRYEHEETWLWLHEVLESETKPVELNDNWETAISNASANPNS